MFNFNQYYNQRAVVSSNENFETLQNARKDLIGEIEAIMRYDNHILMTNDELTKLTWRDIRDEELVHIGELLGLLYYLAPYQKQFVEKGLQEFEERIKKR